MNIKKLENVLNLSIEERYNYFLRKVVEFEEVWGLYNGDGWAVFSDNENRIIIPFWPEKEFASLCCSEQWKNYEPKMIHLDDFINKWLVGMNKDGRLANIFYVPSTKIGSLVSSQILLEDLNEEIEKYL